jgi:hypothetical protein
MKKNQGICRRDIITASSVLSWTLYAQRDVRKIFMLKHKQSRFLHMHDATESPAAHSPSWKSVIHQISTHSYIIPQIRITQQINFVLCRYFTCKSRHKSSTSSLRI